MDKGNIDGRYRCIKKLATGELAEVYLVEASDEATPPRSLALKWMRGRAASNSHKREMFLSEPKILKELKHPCILNLIAEGQWEKRPYFVTEWVEGTDIRKASLGANLNKLHYLFLQLLDVLHYLHSQHVCHLDLKPENILISTTGRPRVVLIDFSLAGWFADHESSSLGLVGTIPYAAPELAEGVPPSVQADLYSLGVVLYELVTGRLPFVGEDLGRVLTEQLQGRFQAVWGEGETVWHGLANVIVSMLQRDPNARPQSVLEIIQQINASENENYQLPFVELYDEVLQKRIEPAPLEPFTGDWKQATQRLFDYYKERDSKKAFAWIKSFWKKEYFAEAPAAFFLEWARLLVDANQLEESQTLLTLVQTRKQMDTFEQGLFYEVKVKRAWTEHSVKEFYENFEKSWSYYEKSNYTSGMIRLYIFRAMMEIRFNQLEAASRDLGEAMVLAEQGGHKFYYVLARSHMGDLVYLRGDWSQADELYEIVIDDYRRLKYPLGQASGLLDRSLVQLNLGKLVEARRCALEAYKIAMERGYTLVLGKSLFNLARIEISLGDRRGQMDYLNEAVKLFEEKQLKFPLMEALVSRAYALKAAGATNKALEDLNRVLVEAKENNPVSYYLALWLKATMTAEKLIPEAGAPDQLILEVIDYFKKIESSKILWEAYSDLGHYYLTQDYPEKAKYYLNLAKQTVDEYLESLPNAFKLSFLRDRKHLEIQNALNQLKRE